MKVILLHDVPKVGRKYDIKDVTPGFARNFLIPKNLGEFATESTMKRYQTLKAKHETERQKKHEELISSIKELANKTVIIEAEANEHGHLFAGIHSDVIAEAIKSQTGLDVDEDHIILKRSIKTTGPHPIAVKVDEEKTTINVEIKTGEKA